MGIRPQEQNCEQQYQNVAHQSKKVILKQLNQDPSSSGSAKHASRYLLVPPLCNEKKSSISLSPMFQKRNLMKNSIQKP